MPDVDGERARRDSEYVRQITRQEKGKYTIVQLPCGHSVELTTTGDQYIECLCGKKFAMTSGRVPILKDSSGDIWKVNK